MQQLIAILLMVPGLAFATLRMDPDTVLTPMGNDEVASRYRVYVTTQPGCRAVNHGPRVIMTGFGLWAGSSVSYSGFVIDNLGSNEFWSPGQMAPNPGRNYVARSGALNSNEGARIYNRSFRLADGREISACLILVDVLWDFAGAVIVHEMERFQPQAVIMMGIRDAGASLEAAATNIAAPITGYYPDGRQDLYNYPQVPWQGILPDIQVGSTVAMNWDTYALASLIRPFFPQYLKVASQADPENNYICNNVTYLALQAAAGRTLNLAGGKLIMRPRITSRPTIGFFHFSAIRDPALERLKIMAQVPLVLARGMLH